MATKTMRYTLENINSIIFNGFEYNLPEKTLETISNLALQVGSPDYVKTPIFKKRENPMKVDPQLKEYGSGGGANKKNRRGKVHEIINDEDWENIRTNQSSSTEEKSGVHSQIDTIRSYLNKMTDKTYKDMRDKIIEVIDKLIEDNISPEDMSQYSSIIFDIASNNRFYSKTYADLYSELCKKYSTLMSTFENNFTKFIDLFNTIEYIDPKVNYDKFCEINKNNEKRKALSSFYVNLMTNGIITRKQIIDITRNLLNQMYTFISIDDKKNEVDELTENIIILYNKEYYESDDGSEYEKINGHTISDIIEIIANSKVKDYKSLTNKSLFKFMDLIDM
jgi:hypothetical protein